MISSAKLSFLCLFVFSAASTLGQSAKTFPSADSMLRDAKHKEPKSGVQIGPGNTITIQTGVGTPTTINVLSFGKQGQLLAAGKDFGRVVVWGIPDRKFLCAVDTGQGIVEAVAISPDGGSLITSGQGDQFSLKLWQLPDCHFENSYHFSRGFVHSLAFGPGGKWLLVSDNSVETYVLDLASGQQVFDLKDTHAPALSLDGSVLMAVTKTDFVLWDTSDWKIQRTFPRTTTSAIPLALNLQSDLFAGTSSSGTFQIERLSTGEALRTSPTTLPKFNMSEGGFASFDPSAPYLLFGHSGGRLWGWDTQTGQTCVSEVLYSEGGSLSPDGSMLAGAKDNSVFAQGQSPDGVLLWDTKRLAQKCGFDPPAAAATMQSAP